MPPRPRFLEIGALPADPPKRGSGAPSWGDFFGGPRSTPGKIHRERPQPRPPRGEPCPPLGTASGATFAKPPFWGLRRAPKRPLSRFLARFSRKSCYPNAFFSFWLPHRGACKLKKRPKKQKECSSEPQLSKKSAHRGLRKPSDSEISCLLCHRIGL